MIKSVVRSLTNSTIRSVIKPGILKPFYYLADENGVLITDENDLLIILRS